MSWFQIWRVLTALRIFLHIRRLADAKRDRYDASAGFGVWRSLVARSVRVGEVLGSNPGTPIMLWRASEYGRSVGTPQTFVSAAVSVTRSCRTRHRRQSHVSSRATTPVRSATNGKKLVTSRRFTAHDVECAPRTCDRTAPTCVMCVSPDAPGRHDWPLRCRPNDYFRGRGFGRPVEIAGRRESGRRRANTEPVSSPRACDPRHTNKGGSGTFCLVASSFPVGNNHCAG